MAVEWSDRGRAAELKGRRRECEVLDRLIEAVRAGESRALVVRGEPGVGKTALLEYAVERASGCRVARAAGVQSEMELAFAGLHQLLAPMLDRVERLPTPQRDALRTAFGLGPASASGRVSVGLAALGLLSDVAEEQPLICVVDDEQWLDRASLQVLAFVARRLQADAVGVVFATRAASDDLAGLPDLAVERLGEDDARTLLDSVLTAPLDARVRDLIVAETRGNPLALLELPRGVTPAELAGGFAFPGVVPLSGRIEESFRRRLEALGAETRRLLLLAAADPVGEPSLLRRAAERLAIGTDAAAPAVEAGLLELGARVKFRHPLVRSAAYRSASRQERQDAHRALAQATDPRFDPDRRAWHRAQAAPGTDEDVASELERSADRAQARGGLAAAAAFLERAAMLTRPPPCAGHSACSPLPEPSGTPAHSTMHWGSWSPSKPSHPMPYEPPRSSTCADRSRSTSDASATLLACSSARRDASSRSTPTPRARRTWRRSARRFGPATWTDPAACWRRPRPRAPRRPPGTRREWWMSCSTRSLCA